MNVFLFFITCKRTNNANNATYYVKLVKKRRKSSKPNYYIISMMRLRKGIVGWGRVIIKEKGNVHTHLWAKQNCFILVTIIPLYLCAACAPPQKGFPFNTSLYKTRDFPYLIFF